MNSALCSSSPLYSNYKAMIGYPQGDYCLYDGSFGAPGKLNDGLAPLYNPTLDVGFVPSPNDLTNLIAASLRNMLPQVQSELSSVNSVIELKDFKTVPRTLNAIRKLAKAPLRKRRAFKNIWHMLQVAADVYLQTKFNIQPLISDVKGVYRSLAKVERRVNDLVSRAGRPRTSHYRGHMDNSAFNTTDTAGQRSLGGFYYLDQVTGFSHQDFYSKSNSVRVTNGGAHFHAELQYNYHYTQYQLEHARVLALLDSFGVNLNPAIIWNAIPWSFVIDWLVGVSQWLSTTRIGLMDPQINIMQYLWSVTYKRDIYVTSKITSPLYYAGTGIPDSSTQSITHPVVSETAYRRVSGLPTVSLLTTSGLSPTEFSLGAALAITRKRHGGKH
jgi:hypothetical protein